MFVQTFSKLWNPLVTEAGRQSFNQSATVSCTSSVCVHLRTFLEPIRHKFIYVGAELRESRRTKPMGKTWWNPSIVNRLFSWTGASTLASRSSVMIEGCPDREYSALVRDNFLIHFDKLVMDFDTANVFRVHKSNHRMHFAIDGISDWYGSLQNTDTATNSLNGSEAFTTWNRIWRQLSTFKNSWSMTCVGRVGRWLLL